MGRTEKHEQEFIDAWIEEERQPNHQEIGRVVLENTDEYNKGFLPYDSEGNYLT